MHSTQVYGFFFVKDLMDWKLRFKVVLPLLVSASLCSAVFGWLESAVERGEAHGTVTYWSPDWLIYYMIKWFDRA